MTLQELSIDHPYYCSDSNYYNNECFFEYPNWKSFVAEMGDADMDMDLLFRWDVKKRSDLFNDDDQGFVVQLFFMQQRKGRFVIHQINSIKESEAIDLTVYLSTRLGKLLELWLPFKPQ